MGDMKRTMFRNRVAHGGVAVLVVTLGACGSDADVDSPETSPGSVSVDGSSTVLPMSQAAYELFSGENPGIQVAVHSSGTGAGFAKFCAGETDISGASRPIDADDESPLCEENGIGYTELQVAVDALTVVVHRELGVQCLTTDQLIELWRPRSSITRWNDLDPAFPDQLITLFGPGTDSGTYDYLADEVIADASETTRGDYRASEDDNVLVQGVAGTPGATSYFGYTYYEKYADSLKMVAIDNGAGCIEPSAETVQAGTYTPLSRPLFIYVNDEAYAANPAVRSYVDYYIENLRTIADAAQYIALSEQQYDETRSNHAGLSD